MIPEIVRCGDWQENSVRDITVDWEIPTYHQCLTLLVPNIRQPFNLVARCLKRHDTSIVGYALVKANSFMLSKWYLVVCEAILHVNGYIEDLEPLFHQLKKVPVLRSITNIAFIYNIVLEEIVEQTLGCNCHICLISWVLAKACGTPYSPIDSTCHIKCSRRTCRVQVL